MKKSVMLAMVLGLAIVAGGCAAKKPRGGAGAGSTVPADTSASAAAGAETAGPNSGAGAVTTVTPPANDGFGPGPSGELLSKRVLYFAFDRDELRSEDQAIVAAHSKYLVSNPSVKVRLEGHTDERGAREYNIGLGERRAQAVRRALMLQGVGEAQLSTVSFGEERPAVPGEDETAWSQNRRVEILYAN